MMELSLLRVCALDQQSYVLVCKGVIYDENACQSRSNAQEW